MVVDCSADGLIRTTPDKARGPEPCGVRASLSLGSREAKRLGRFAGTLSRTMVQRPVNFVSQPCAGDAVGDDERAHHAGLACVDSGKAAVHVGTSSALRLRVELAPRSARQSCANLAAEVSWASGKSQPRRCKHVHKTDGMTERLGSKVVQRQPDHDAARLLALSAQLLHAEIHRDLVALDPVPHAGMPQRLTILATE